MDPPGGLLEKRNIRGAGPPAVIHSLACLPTYLLARDSVMDQKEWRSPMS